MAERPRAGSGDDPDYDWIYGQDSRRAPGGDPEPTRKMPVTPRPESHSSRSRAPQRPTGPPAAPKRGRRRPRPRSWVRTILALIVLWLIFLVAVPIFAWARVEKIAFEPGGERPGEQPGTNYLMIGSDSRAGLSPEERREFSTGNAQSSLADTIMVLHTGSGPNVLLSFPRDWVVDGRKINGYYDPGDPTALVAALESETGIRIDEYVEIGLGGVAGVVDAVGGIEICPEQAIEDPKAGLDVQQGCQEADGATALGYSRTRATAQGDLDRVGRQREVVGAIGEKVISPWTVLNPLRWWNLNNAIPDFFAFGEGTNQYDVGRWALAMTRIGDGRTCTMPVTDASATVMDTERAEPLFAAVIEGRTDDITPAQCTAAGVPQ